MSPHLRPYTPADLDALVALDDLCFAAAFRFSRSAMRRFAEAPNARTLLAEDEGQLAGFAILHIESSHTEGSRTGYIVTLDVAPAHRRLGLATRLMEAIEAQARDAGCTALALHVHTGNAAALRFYRKLGFAFSHAEPDFYAPGFDAEVYRRPITRPIAPPGPDVILAS